MEFSTDPTPHPYDRLHEAEVRGLAAIRREGDSLVWVFPHPTKQVAIQLRMPMANAWNLPQEMRRYADLVEAALRSPPTTGQH